MKQVKSYQLDLVLLNRKLNRKNEFVIPRIFDATTICLISDKFQEFLNVDILVKNQNCDV
jgi:hypothetical protein